MVGMCIIEMWMFNEFKIFIGEYRLYIFLKKLNLDK